MNSMRKKLSLKIIVIVSFILLLSMSLTGAYFIKSERALLFKRVYSEAARINKNIENLLVTLVTMGVPDAGTILRDVMKEQNYEDILEVKLIHAPDLVKTFLDKQNAEKYNLLRKSDPQNATERRVISGQTIAERTLVSINGKKLHAIRYASPIKAEKRCFACHAVREGQVMGAFFSIISLEDAYQAIRRRTIENIFLFGIVFILILITLYLSLRKMVLRPLIKISRAVSNIIEKQDLSEQVEVRSLDEIGQLGTVFNKMVGDLKRSRDRLLESKNYTDSIIANMLDTLIVVDPEGIIKTVNKTTLDLLGYREDELIGYPVGKIFVETDIFKGSRLRKLIEDGSVRDFEMVYRTKSGEKIPVSFSGSLMRGEDGAIAGVVGVVRDTRQIRNLIIGLEKAKGQLEEWAKTLEKKVYDRTKELEQSQEAALNMMEDLVEAKDYTEDIINSMSDTLIVADSSGKMKMVNSALVELLGYGQDELIGKPIASIFDEETAKSFNETEIKKMTEEYLVRNHEAIYKAKSGENIAVSFSVSLMRGESDRPLDLIIVSKDIREIKHLLELEKQKASELKVAYEKLQELQDALIQAEKFNAIGQLASGVAHEVKNPLGIIKQSAEYLKGKFRPSEKNAAEALRMIEDNIERADKIIRVLLDFSRAKKLEQKPEDINSILESSLVLIQHIPMLVNIKIIRELGKDLPKVLVDRAKLEQVFINLLLNAVQAMPEGGNIFLRTYQTRLDKLKNGLGASGENYFRLGEIVLVVEIEDTGIGISPEDFKKIFDPFFSTKEPGQGTGLGLSISKNILAMHKGLIEMESREGVGTKVIITLKIIDGGSNE